jgi:hypothetical protein
MPRGFLFVTPRKYSSSNINKQCLIKIITAGGGCEELSGQEYPDHRCGKLMAHYVADELANTALIDINGAAVANTVEEVKSRNVKVSGYVCNISKRDAVMDVVAKIKQDFGPIDVLINNAGTVIGKSFFDLTLDEMQLGLCRQQVRRGRIL